MWIVGGVVVVIIVVAWSTEHRLGVCSARLLLGISVCEHRTLLRILAKFCNLPPSLYMLLGRSQNSWLLRFFTRRASEIASASCTQWAQCVCVCVWVAVSAKERMGVFAKKYIKLWNVHNIVGTQTHTHMHTCKSWWSLKERSQRPDDVVHPTGVGIMSHRARASAIQLRVFNIYFF